MRDRLGRKFLRTQIRGAGRDCARIIAEVIGLVEAAPIAYVGSPGGVSEASWPTTTVHGRTCQFLTSPPVT